jgi:hypothetical protein
LVVVGVVRVGRWLVVRVEGVVVVVVVVGVFDDSLLVW